MLSLLSRLFGSPRAASGAALASPAAVCGLALWLALAGCERPELDLGHVPGATGQGTGGSTGDGDGGDSGGDADAATDSGTTGGEMDASGGSTGGDTDVTGGSGTTSTTGTDDAGGCPDDDGDEVCNADDNCPDTANPEQQDSDGDGTGNACESCGLSVTSGVVRAPPGTLSDDEGQAFIGNVDINKSGSNVATVAAGSQVTVDLEYAVKLCASTQQHIVVGIAGESPECLAETSCIGRPEACNIPVVTVGCDPEIPGSVTLTAPTTPDEYYILVDHGLGGCGGWSGGSEPGSEQRIGGLCVQ